MSVFPPPKREGDFCLHFQLFFGIIYNVSDLPAGWECACLIFLERAGDFSA